MRKTTAALLFILAISSTLYAQNSRPRILTDSIPADSLRKRIDKIVNELSLGHPGFYRYTSKKEFSAYIDSVKATFNGNTSELDAYLNIKALVSKVGCLHTGISFKQEYMDELNRYANLLPLQLYFDDAKAFVINNYSGDNSVTSGAEVVSINGHSIDELLKRLLPLIPSDGYNQTMKMRALYFQFPLWYRLIDPAESFTVSIRQNKEIKTHHIKAARFENIAREGFLKEPRLPRQLDFRIENKTAFLTIHTFAKSRIKESGQDFKQFVSQAFRDIKKQNIQNLVVDLRDNTGGSDPNAVYFTSHFFDKPFAYGDRTEVTGHIARQIKGIYTLLFKKPVQKDSVWLWRDGIVKDLNTFPTVQPARNNYTGKTYVLINGFCMSSCANVAALLSYNKKAVFIGEETGGGYQGNSSGMMPEVTLWNYVLTVPLHGYYLAVDKKKNVGHGTMPDISVRPETDDLIGGEDTLMKFVRKLVLSHP